MLRISDSFGGWRIVHKPTGEKVYTFKSRAAARRAVAVLTGLRVDWSFTDPCVCLKWPRKTRLSIIKRLWQLDDTKRTHPWSKELRQMALTEERKLQKEWARRRTC